MAEYLATQRSNNLEHPTVQKWYLLDRTSEWNQTLMSYHATWINWRSQNFKTGRKRPNHTDGHFLVESCRSQTFSPKILFKNCICLPPLCKCESYHTMHTMRLSLYNLKYGCERAKLSKKYIRKILELDLKPTRCPVNVCPVLDI